jgi:hypothetical protein
MFELDILIPAAGVVFAFIVGARIAYVMGLRYGAVDPYTDSSWMIPLIGGAAAGIIAGFATTAATQNGGLICGIIADILMLPAVGLIWIFIVGGNRALERIITNLLNKLDSKASG